jgi:hypothetical protein
MKMIKKKLIAFISTLSLASVVAMAAAVSANAANVELKYNEELSTATLKVVDVNYSVEAPLFSFGGRFDVNCPGATVAYEKLVKYEAGLTPNGTSLGMDWSDLDFVGDVPASGTHGRLNVTVPEGTGEFTVSFCNIAVMDLDMGEYEVADITITIPGATVEPPVDPEPPVVEPEPETINATSAGKFTKWEDAKTQAFKANLTAAQAAKTVTWNVTDGTQSQLLQTLAQ